MARKSAALRAELHEQLHTAPTWRSCKSISRAERSNKIIWETVMRVADRVGVRATVHALRRAFAVAFLTSHPGAIESLQALMNHSRIDTTQVYLRALNRSKAMEAGSRPLLELRTKTAGCRGAYGIRTRAAAVRGRCPRPLDECARRGLIVATAGRSAVVRWLRKLLGRDEAGRPARPSKGSRGGVSHAQPRS
jgi:Phage integrase family